MRHAPRGTRLRRRCLLFGGAHSGLPVQRAMQRGARVASPAKLKYPWRPKSGAAFARARSPVHSALHLNRNGPGQYTYSKVPTRVPGAIPAQVYSKRHIHRFKKAFVCCFKFSFYTFTFYTQIDILLGTNYCLLWCDYNIVVYLTVP